MIILFLLLVPIVPISGRLNACGSYVGDYDNYVNISLKIHVEQIADLALREPRLISPVYRDLMDKDIYLEYFDKYPSMVTDVTIGSWTRSSDGVRSRNVTYLVESVFVHQVHQTEKIHDEQRWVEVVTITAPYHYLPVGTSASDPVNYEMTTRRCVAPGTQYQIDIRGTVDGIDFREVQDLVRMVYNSVALALRKLEDVHYRYSFDFRFEKSLAERNHREEITSTNRTSAPLIPEGYTTYPHRRRVFCPPSNGFISFHLSIPVVLFLLTSTY